MSGLQTLRRRAWHFNGNVDLANRLHVHPTLIQQFAIGRIDFDDQQLNQLALFIGHRGYDVETDTLKE